MSGCLIDLLIQGALIFLAGNVLQHHSHAILARLSKREKEGAPAQDTAEHYCLPSGGLSILSCPEHRHEVQAGTQL